MVYGPGVSAAKLNRPTSFVVVVRTAPDVALVAVTDAPGTTPTLSYTVPLIVPVPWAFAMTANVRQSIASTDVIATARGRTASIVRLLFDLLMAIRPVYAQ